MTGEQQLNVQVPEELYREVKKAAIDGQLRLRKFVEFLLGLGLYLKENLGAAETFQIVKESQPLAFLLAARNDLSHKGFNTSNLDTVIGEVEAFLEKRRNRKDENCSNA
ncbi:MAG: hypothetical protein ACPLW8_01465 [Candidatus Bathyarchaeales archaeon]